jgi:hypothetical protein
MEFRADGTFVEAIAVLVNAYYRLDGSRVVLSETVGGKEAGSQEFRVEGNSLLQKGPDGSTLRKDRMKGDGATPGSILGSWRYRHYTGAIAFERYTSGGQMFFRLPMRSWSGCYTLNGGEVSWLRDGRIALAKFELRGNWLALRTSSTEYVYDRQDAGPWYEREHLDIRPVR